MRLFPPPLGSIKANYCGNVEEHQKKGKQGYSLNTFISTRAFSLENPIQVVIATEIEALVESLFMEEDSSEQVMIMFYAQAVNKIFQE